MRVPLRWLGELVDLPEAEELARRLTQGGLETEVERGDEPGFTGVLVGHVLERRQHPNADRLSVCSVDVGRGEPLEIVCGAPNVAAGQRVAVAPPGARLPGGKPLKRAKLRGVVSHGMICSERELGLGDDHEGILVLSTDAPPGTAFATLAGGGSDRWLEISLTPNRGDCASLLGVAREVRAHFGGPLRLPPSEVVAEGGATIDSAFRVRIDDPGACYRYVARLVRGVQIGPSPPEVAERLRCAGFRPLHNAIDATHLALLEFGQPLHAFDAATLRGGRVEVRRARPGEELLTLDGVRRCLDPEDLVIADAERPIALAGVMGGAETEVTPATNEILIESAHFDPVAVRRSARRHGLSTEASYRFERGVDRGGVERAADRAALLLIDLAGGVAAPGRIVVQGEAPPAVNAIALDPERTNRLLGTALAVETMQTQLTQLGVESEDHSRTGGGLLCLIPSHRNDLSTAADLAEEIARMVGYEHIAATLPVAQLRPVPVSPLRQLTERVRDLLCGLGLIEAQTLPMESSASHDALGLATSDPRRHALALRNPLAESECLLRTDLCASMLRLVRHNLSRQRDEVRAFEIGSVFLPVDGEALPQEPPHLVVALAGAARGLWHHPPPPYFAIKGIGERLFHDLGLRYAERMDALEPFLHPGASVRFEIAGQSAAALGELHPDVAQRFDIEAPCALLSADLSQLLAHLPARPRFAAASRYPSVRRDLAFVVDRQQSGGELVAAARGAAGKHLIAAEIFDRYEGQGIREGAVSIALGLVFQHAERTLTEGEVNRAVENVVQTIGERCGGELR